MYKNSYTNKNLTYTRGIDCVGKQDQRCQIQEYISLLFQIDLSYKMCAKSLSLLIKRQMD